MSNLMKKLKEQFWGEASKAERFAMVFIVVGLVWLIKPSDPPAPEPPNKKSEIAYPETHETKSTEPKPESAPESVEPSEVQPAASQRTSKSLGFSQTVEEFIEDYNLMLRDLGFDKRLSVESETGNGNLLTVTLKMRGTGAATVTLKANSESRKITHVSCFITESDTQQETLRSSAHVVAALVLTLERDSIFLQNKDLADVMYNATDSIGMGTVLPNQGKVTLRDDIEYTLTRGPNYYPITITVEPEGAEPAVVRRPSVKPSWTNPERAELAKFMDESQTESFPFTSTKFVERFNQAMMTLHRPEERLHEFERLEGGIVVMRMTVEGKSAAGVFDLTALEHRSGKVGMIICYLSPAYFDIHRILAVAMAAADEPWMPISDRSKIMEELDFIGLFGEAKDATTVHGNVLYGYAPPRDGMPATFMAQPL